MTTYFLYDGGTPLLEETFSSPNATLSAVNVWSADGWRARHYPDIGDFRAFSFDPQGNVVQRQNGANGSYPILDTASYEAYGKRTADIGTGGLTPGTQDPAGFGGQYGYYTDRETGLLCLTHRYYDPGTGRFINRDPIGYQGGVNLYGFAGGNPVNDSDPSGLKKKRTFWQRVAHWFFGSADIGVSKARHGVEDIYDIDGVKEADQAAATVGSTSKTLIVGSAGIIALAVVTAPLEGAGGAAGGAGVAKGYRGMRAAKSFDWAHIFDNHAFWGSSAQARMAREAAGEAGSRVYTYFYGMSAREIQKAVKGAWANRKLVYSQVGENGVLRQTFQGVDPKSGKTIEMWFNTSTKAVETAYPVP